MPPEAWSASTYVRRNTGHTQFTLRPGKGEMLRHSMRFACVEELTGVPHRFRVWARSASEWAAWGEVEDMAAE